MHKKLLVATGNAGKLKEIKALLAPLGIEAIGLKDIKFPVEIVEDGETFADNALKKARALSRLTGLATLGDDSGLVVEALGGRPGVRSARYSGEDATDASNNAKLLKEMEGIADRRAAFACVMALVAGADEHLAEGRLEGSIALAPSGDGGFGYDPLFIVEGHGATLANIPLEEKNAISHRGKALRAMVPKIEDVFKDN